MAFATRVLLALALLLVLLLPLLSGEAVKPNALQIPHFKIPPIRVRPSPNRPSRPFRPPRASDGEGKCIAACYVYYCTGGRGGKYCSPYCKKKCDKNPPTTHHH